MKYPVEKKLNQINWSRIRYRK